MSKTDISYETGGNRAIFGPGAPTSARRRSRPITLAVLIDGLAFLELTLVVLTAWAVKVGYLDIYLGAVEPTLPYVGVAAVLAYILFFTFRRLGLYQPPRVREKFLPVGRLTLGLGGSFLLLITALYVFKEAEQFSRGWMLLWFAISGAAILGSRTMFGMVLRSFVARGAFRQQIAVYGAGELGRSVVSYLRDLAPDVEVAGIFDDRRSSDRGTVLPVDGGLSDLVEFGKGEGCDKIVVAVPVSEDRLARVMDELSVLPVDVQLCPETMSLPCAVFGLSRLGRLNLLDVQKRPMSPRIHYMKSAMDFLLAAIGLALVLPFFPLIALAIKLDSPGPIFFRQRRHGYNHQIIRIIKFRTMTVMEDGPVVEQVRKGDARVTRVGRFLRTTNIDELPQLLNVLKGEMSLVGPRPHALAHDEFYANLVRRYGSRLRVKPGITGWAQVNGFSGETADPDLMRRRVEHDVYYIDNCSVWLDLEILVRTVFLALSGRLVH